MNKVEIIKKLKKRKKTGLFISYVFKPVSTRSIKKVQKLRTFPKNVKNIDIKEENYQVTKTLGESLIYYKKKYEKHRSFGDDILAYGISLLENGFMKNAGEILNYVWGAEDWDRMWPYALFHKARIAAILEEIDYLKEFLRRTFRAQACLGFPQQDKLKKMIEKLPEFHKYTGSLSFRRIINHNYKNKEDRDKFDEEIYCSVQILQRERILRK